MQKDLTEIEAQFHTPLCSLATIDPHSYDRTDLHHFLRRSTVHSRSMRRWMVDDAVRNMGLMPATERLLLTGGRCNAELARYWDRGLLKFCLRGIEEGVVNSECKDCHFCLRVVKRRVNIQLQPMGAVGRSSHLSRTRLTAMPVWKHGCE